MKRREFIKKTAAAGTIALITPTGLLYSRENEDTTNALNQSFKSPPESAKPYTWWHWMNGNVTKEGITRDLEGMAEVGIGGFQAFSVTSGIPSGPADYLSPLWIELMDHAANEASRLGLEFDLHNCMGWTSSGGSWITPELSMQQVVWTEAFVEGGKTINKKLKEPFKRLGYYRDTYVLAFPSIGGKNGPAQVQPQQITLNGKALDADTLIGFDLSSSIEVNSQNSSEPSFLTLEFDQPVDVGSLAISTSNVRNNPELGDTIVLEASNNGRKYEKVTEVDDISENVEIPTTATFPKTKAKYFRLKIPMVLTIANVRLSASDGIREWPYKANFPHQGYYPEIELDPAKEIGNELSEGAINPNRVIDITQHMDERGVLDWDAPEGHWTIIRFGQTSTGSTNHPAAGKGKGLECDKYSSEAFDFHFNYLMDHLWPALEPLAKNDEMGMLIDSYEVGLQNWTKKMPQEFKKRRGYEIYNFLPVLTGRAVGGVNTSERFLWDFRKTCSEMMVDNYQGRFVELCEEHNIISYTEPYNHSPFNQMEAGKEMDINMGEFWLKTSHFCHSLKVAASNQNMNGRQIVGAESFTGRPFYSKWQAYPFALKTQGDFMYTRGLNRFIFHTYTHQPHPTAVPGMTMGQWGFHFYRTNTWFFQGKKWLEYASRCQFMLQQGVFVGDVLCFTSQEAPGDDISMGALRPGLPAGYDFQFANTDILLNRIRIEDGRIVLPDGMSFRVLVLPDKKIMTLEVARKLKGLVRQGMILIGERPEAIPTLSNYPNSVNEFDQIVEELWGQADGQPKENTLGKGRVFAGMSIKKVLDKLDIKPDFEFTSKSGDAPINYIHRKLEDGHAYFVANRRRFDEDLLCAFRVSGYEPEIWDPDTGEVIPVNVYDSSNSRTSIPLHLEPGGSVFVIFKSPDSKQRLLSIEQDGKTIASAKNIKVDDQKYDKQITNNFTISLWVKPETDERLPDSLGEYPETTRYTSSYPVYAPPGKELFGEGHASFCLLAARNGVVVFEKKNDDLSAVLISRMPISSWTHFTVVYQDGEPALYVNGEFVKKGEESGKVVHPVIGEYLKNEKLFYYNGDLSAPEVFDYPLSASKVKELSANGRPIPAHNVSLEPVKGEQPTFLYWQNGEYIFEDTKGRETEVSISGINKPMELSGNWRVGFPSGLGAPQQVILDKLHSLHKHSEDGVKYFSGTATYHKKFKAEASLFADQKRVFLDLGRVAVIAEVQLNGEDLGIVWKPPYRLDITDIVKAGENDLQVRVTNLWPNRLIGDEQLPAENEYEEFGPKGAGIKALPDWYKEGKLKPAGGRVTFSTWKHFDEDDPLLESGLIGPVVIRHAVIKPIYN